MGLIREGSILEQAVALIGSKPHPPTITAGQAHLTYLSFSLYSLCVAGLTRILRVLEKQCLKKYTNTCLSFCKY